jgi:hypothetical protein
MGKSSRRRRVTLLVVAIWALALVGPALLAPSPADAGIGGTGNGWMTYAPNHPNGCVPLPYDCYVIWVYPS